MKRALLPLLICSMLAGCSTSHRTNYLEDFGGSGTAADAIALPFIIAGAFVVAIVAEDIDYQNRYGNLNAKYDRWEADRRKLAKIEMARRQSTSTQLAEAPPLPAGWRELITNYEESQSAPGDATRVVGR